MTHPSTQETSRSRQKADRRAQLMKMAAELFADKGFGAVSMEDLGASAGVTGPALYKHFRNKQHLLGELLVDISRRLLQGGREVAAKSGSDEDALEALVDFHIDFALTEPELIRVQERDITHLTAEDRRAVRRLQRSYVELWVSQLMRIEDGMSVEEARIRTHGVFGLLNSTPHSANQDPDRTRRVLKRMAFSALKA